MFPLPYFRNIVVGGEGSCAYRPDGGEPCSTSQAHAYMYIYTYVMYVYVELNPVLVQLQVPTMASFSGGDNPKNRCYGSRRCGARSGCRWTPYASSWILREVGDRSSSHVDIQTAAKHHTSLFYPHFSTSAPGLPPANSLDPSPFRFSVRIRLQCCLPHQ